MKKDSHSSGIIKMCLSICAMLIISIITYGGNILQANIPQNGILKLENNEQYTISQNDTVIITKLELAKGCTLTINGTLRFEDNNGSLSDFNIDGNELKGNNETKIENNGIIECHNFDQSLSSIQKNAIYTFNNNGEIICIGNFNSYWNTNANYISSDNAKIVAQNIIFADRAGWDYKGSYIAEQNFTIDNTIGNNNISITGEEFDAEKDYKTIVVEYSKNGTDWREIDQVDGMGTTSFATQYSSIVTNDFPQGFLYFRLKEITFDGIESVSHTIVYENTPSSQSFKSLQYGHLNILYNDNERRYVKQ